MEIVIRIYANEKDAYDWPVDPNKVTFHDTMQLITRQIFRNGPTITAFEYVDEDGDLITVRSEEEMKQLVAVHVKEMTQGGSPHLQLYPKVGKTQGKRNVCGLKVHTTAEQSEQVTPIDSGGRSRKQEPQDIAEILAGHPLTAGDVHMLESLGSGSAGTVYKACHKNTGAEMAVKMIKLDITPDSQETQNQIMSELQVLYKCRSPFIIDFYGAYFVESRISICMEYMNGGTLDMYKKIVEPVLGRMTVALVSGLYYLWSLKIMHRDVKPVNLLVNTRGQVKLCDFSISVQLAESMAKTVIGTHAYMAPERLLGQEYRITSDVWSLGVSLFELATGLFPYGKSNNPIELMKSIVYEDPPQLPSNAVSDVFSDFIHKCMRKDPKQRPLPEALMQHPLINQYNDGNLEIVAQWVCFKREQMRSQGQSTASQLAIGSQ